MATRVEVLAMTIAEEWQAEDMASVTTVTWAEDIMEAWAEDTMQVATTTAELAVITSTTIAAATTAAAWVDIVPRAIATRVAA